MKPKEMYHLLNDLSEKLNTIAEQTDDYDAADQLQQIVQEIDDNADKVLHVR